MTDRPEGIDREAWEGLSDEQRRNTWRLLRKERREEAAQAPPANPAPRAKQQAEKVGDMADEPPKSWLGKKARAIKEKARTSKPGKAAGWVDREVVGGLREVNKEFGISRAAGKNRAGAGKIQAGTRKRTAFMDEGRGRGRAPRGRGHRKAMAGPVSTPAWSMALGGGGGGQGGGSPPPRFMTERGPLFMQGGMGGQGGGQSRPPHFMSESGPAFMGAMGWGKKTPAHKPERRAARKKSGGKRGGGSRTITIRLGR